MINQYQQRLGSLRYLADRTRVDIAYDLRVLATKQGAPTQFDSEQLTYMLQYIASTPDLGLLFHSNEGVKLFATADISYATQKDCKSFTSGTLSIGKLSAPFRVYCKPQTVMTDSTATAEYVGASTISKEAVSARMFMDAVGFGEDAPTPLGQDNMSTIHMMENTSSGAKTKHIDVRFHVLRDYIVHQLIKPYYLKTKLMQADLLNKTHGPASHRALRELVLGYRNGIDPVAHGWIPQDQLVL